MSAAPILAELEARKHTGPNKDGWPLVELPGPEAHQG